MTLTKVTFHYSDGSKQFITGEELGKWTKMNSQVASYAQFHGMNPGFEEIQWSKVPSSKDEQDNFESYKAKDEQEEDKN